MVGLRKPTEALRATVTQQSRVILEPEPNDVPPTVVRRVTVLTPSSATISICIDPPNDIAQNVSFDYLFMQLPSGLAVTFFLQPQQRISGMSSHSTGYATLIVEYLHGVP